MRAVTSEQLEKSYLRDFADGPVVETSHFHCRGVGSIPGPGARILHLCGQKKKKRIICDWDAVPFLFFSEKLGKDTSVCNQKWGPTAHCPKANKEAKLVERKVCFILDAGNWGVEGGRVDNCPKADSPPTLTIRGQELLYTEGGGYM